MKNLLTAFCFLFAMNLATAQTNMKIEDGCYSESQLSMIQSLLDDTQTTLTEKTSATGNSEEYSKVIMLNSYKFAKAYSSILELNSVPFDLIVSSTKFINCWAEGDFTDNDTCLNGLVQSIETTKTAKLD